MNFKDIFQCMKLATLLQLSFYLLLCNSLSLRHKVNTRRFNLGDTPNWMNRKNEVVIIKETKPYDPQIPLFDRVHLDNSQGKHTLSSLCLREISESYSISLSYLGDLCIQLGCHPPIDTDSPIGNYLTGDQIYNIIEAVNTLDPLELNLDYDSMDIETIAEEYDISIDRVILICEREKFNLPYGKDTILHITEADRLREILESLDDSYETYEVK